MQFEILDQRLKHDQQSRVDGVSDSRELLDRGAMFGDGFFTTGKVIQGKIEGLDGHMARIQESLTRLKFNSVHPEQLEQQLTSHCQSLQKAAFRLTISRQQAARGYAISQTAVAVARLQLFDLPPMPEQACHLIEAETPISVNPYLAGIKHLNRLDNLLAASEITQVNQEALMFHQDQLICGSRSNIFVKIAGCWCTPRLDIAGIKGITRQRVMHQLADKAIELIERPIFRSEISSIQAAFVTNSLIGVWAVDRLIDQKLDLAAAERIGQWYNESYPS